MPVHDVVNLVRTLLRLSDASYVRELLLPAIRDERFQVLLNSIEPAALHALAHALCPLYQVTIP